MECQICLEEFNSTERRPKLLPCGHTSCLRCLKELPESKCPVDRKDFSGPPNKLADNLEVLSSSPRPRPKFWCCDCKKTATSKECVEWHTLCSMNKVNLEKATSLLASLSFAVKGVNAQIQALEKVRELLARHSFRSERQHERLKKAHENLQQAIEARGTLTEQMDAATTALAEMETGKVMGLICGDDNVSVTLTETQADPYLLHLQNQIASYRHELAQRSSPLYTANYAPAAFWESLTSSPFTTSGPFNNFTFGFSSSASMATLSTSLSPFTFSSPATTTSNTTPASSPFFSPKSATTTTTSNTTSPSFPYGTKSETATTASSTTLSPCIIVSSPKSATATTTSNITFPSFLYSATSVTTATATSSTTLSPSTVSSSKSATATTTSNITFPSFLYGTKSETAKTTSGTALPSSRACSPESATATTISNTILESSFTSLNLATTPKTSSSPTPSLSGVGP